MKWYSLDTDIIAIAITNFSITTFPQSNHGVNAEVMEDRAEVMEDRAEAMEDRAEAMEDRAEAQRQQNLQAQEANRSKNMLSCLHQHIIVSL